MPEEFRLIDESMPARPSSLYAATKVWGEAIARHYVDTFGLEIACLRIGFVNREDRPVNPRHFSVWTSQRDVVNAIRLALNAGLEEGFGVFFILSENKWAYRNIMLANKVLGYSPQDTAESFR